MYRLDDALASPAEQGMDREAIQFCLDLLATRLGQNRIPLDAAAVANIPMRDAPGLEIAHPEGAAGVIVTRQILGAEDAVSSLMTLMLQANLDWSRSGGGSFGLSPDGRVTLSCFIRLADFDAERAEAELEAFVELTDAWRAQAGLLLDELPGDDAEDEGGGRGPTLDQLA